MTSTNNNTTQSKIDSYNTKVTDITDNITVSTYATLGDLANYLGSDFKASDWSESDHYFVHCAAQGSIEWEKIRKKVLISGSKAAIAINKYRFMTREQYFKELTTGVTDKVFTAEELQRMKLGNTLEPILRQWLATTFKLKIIEVGFIIPKFDLETGYSADGLIQASVNASLPQASINTSLPQASINTSLPQASITNTSLGKANDAITQEGIIEIKTAQKMPWRLTQYKQLIASGWIAPPLYHDHIYDSHYCQMQKGMADTNREYCIYLVYDVHSREIYVEKIMRNRQYWNQVLYPGIRQLIENYKMGSLDNPRI